MTLNKTIKPRSTNQDTATGIVVIIILSVVMALFPFLGLCMSVLFFRKKFAPWLFIAFAFYFGWMYEPQMDLLNHYTHFHRILGKSLSDQWNNPGTLRVGKEIYPVLFKYVLGLISDNKNLFSACACTIYTALFVFGILIPLRPFYIQKMRLSSWLLFLGVIFTVEYYWFLGFRFWSGVFVFTGFYLRYLISNKIKYLWLSALCLCFHYSLIALFFIAVLNHFIRVKVKYYYLLLIASFVIRFAKIAIITVISQFGIFEGYVKSNVRDKDLIKSGLENTERIREYDNQFYLLRETIMIFGAIAAIIILYKNTGSKFIKQNYKFWTFCILLLSVANFGYTSFTFYDRFFKIAVLFIYIFAFLWSINAQSKLSLKSQAFIIIFTIIPVLYSIITPLIEQRRTLFQLKLWFSNLFLQ